MDTFLLCTSKCPTSSVCHYVKDGILDHLAVFFTTTFPVRNSCRIKHWKVRKLGKINKYVFISDISNFELIQAAYKTASLLSHQYFHTLRNLLDKHAPIHECKTPQNVNKGFIDSEIWAAKRHKCNLERQWGRDNSAINHSRYRATVKHFNPSLNVQKPNTTVTWLGKMRITLYGLVEFHKKVLHKSPKIVLPDHTTINSLTFLAKHLQTKLLNWGLDYRLLMPIPLSQASTEISLLLSGPCQRTKF